MIAPVFMAPVVSPAVEAALAEAWKRLVEAEHPLPAIVESYRPRGIAQLAIEELMSDGEWHTVEEIAAAGDVAHSRVQRYLRRLSVERRSFPARGGRGGRPRSEWRLA